MVCRLVTRVSVFKNLTEMEKASVPCQANKLFTLSGIHQATRILLAMAKKKQLGKQQEDLAFEYWQEVGRSIPDWLLASQKKVSCIELRRDYVHAHGVALTALGVLGAALMTHEPKGWKVKLQKLRNLDWARSSSEVWEGRALVGGRVSKAHINLLLTSSLLKQHVGVPLADSEQQIETDFRQRKFARNAS